MILCFHSGHTACCRILRRVVILIRLGLVMGIRGSISAGIPFTIWLTQTVYTVHHTLLSTIRRCLGSQDIDGNSKPSHSGGFVTDIHPDCPEAWWWFSVLQVPRRKRRTLRARTATPSSVKYRLHPAKSAPLHLSKTPQSQTDGNSSQKIVVQRLRDVQMFRRVDGGGCHWCWPGARSPRSWRLSRARSDFPLHLPECWDASSLSAADLVSFQPVKVKEDPRPRGWSSGRVTSFL